MRTRVLLSRAVAGIAALVVLTGAACGSSKSTSTATPASSTQAGTAAAGEPYVVGSTSDLSGPIAFEGTALRDGLRAYLSYVNQQGGVNGHPIKYVALDDRSDPNTGIANVKQLVGQHAVVILGWGLSNVIEAALPSLQQDNMPIIAQSLTGDMLHPVKPVLFGGDMSIADEAAPEVSFASGQLSNVAHPKVALFTYVSAVDAQFRQAAQQLVKAKGWDLVADQVVQLTATDLSAPVAAIARAKPDFVLMSLVDPQAVLAVSGLRQQGLNVPVVNYDGGSGYTTLQKLHDPNFYVLRPYGFATDSGSGIATFGAATKAAGVDPNTPFLINGYMQAVVLVGALKSCGFPCSSAKLENVMNSLGAVDTGGVAVAPLLYSNTDHAGIQDARIYKWDTQSSKPVAASELLPVGQK